MKKSSKIYAILPACSTLVYFWLLEAKIMGFNRKKWLTKNTLLLVFTTLAHIVDPCHYFLLLNLGGLPVYRRYLTLIEFYFLGFKPTGRKISSWPARWRLKGTSFLVSFCSIKTKCNFIGVLNLMVQRHVSINID